jgi:hypothetical protein
MMILARPSLSPYLSRTLFELDVPVVMTEDVAVPMHTALRKISTADLGGSPKLAYQSLILTSSENALSRLYELIPHDERVLKSRIFKDKVAFRRALSSRFKDFFFREIPLSELGDTPPKGAPYPLVLKPAVGISSIGVTRVESPKDWKRASNFLRDDFARYQKNYERNVVESSSLILEEYLEGAELAVDGYFGSDSKPVILNILEHLFSGPEDTSDLVYYTRRSLVKKHYGPLLKFLREFGEVFDLKRFPFHLEVRVNKQGKITPIELNPLRFAGLGTTELAEYAWGINVYRYFFEERAPDWEKILRREDDSVFSFLCADLSGSVFKKKGLVIHDRDFFRQFHEILDYRILDERETSTFAVIFYRSDDLKENQRLLKLDLSQFYSFKS